MKIYRPYGRCNISGERVRAARERAGISQERLAYKIQIAGLDITQKAISRIETGDRIVADYELEYLADAIGVTIYYLLGKERKQRSQSGRAAFLLSPLLTLYNKCCIVKTHETKGEALNMETITTGKRLKALREDRGLSQSQLAKKADINSRVLQTYEQDDRDIAGAKLKTLLKVCVALECRLEDIVTDDETLALIAAYNRR